MGYKQRLYVKAVIKQDRVKDNTHFCLGKLGGDHRRGRFEDQDDNSTFQ